MVPRRNGAFGDVVAQQPGDLLVDLHIGRYGTNLLRYHLTSAVSRAGHRGGMVDMFADTDAPHTNTRKPHIRITTLGVRAHEDKIGAWFQLHGFHPAALGEEWVFAGDLEGRQLIHFDVIHHVSPSHGLDHGAVAPAVGQDSIPRLDVLDGHRTFARRDHGAGWE